MRNVNVLSLSQLLAGDANASAFNLVILFEVTNVTRLLWLFNNHEYVQRRTTHVLGGILDRCIDFNLHDTVHSSRMYNSLI